MTLAPSASGRRAALVFIFVAVLIDVLAFGVIIPVLPHLIESFLGGSTSKAALWVGVFSFSFSLVQFFSMPVLGALSDRYGRRPVILLSCLGLSLDFVLMAIAPDLWWLFVGRILSAMTSASFSTANAYIADITAPDERARSFGMIGAAFGLGFILGPLIGGVLGDYHARAPFWLSAGLAMANVIYGLFVLPESLPPEQRTERFDWSQVHPFGGFAMLREYPQIWGLAAVVFIANLAHYVYPSTFVLFAGERYDWGTKEAGYVLAVVGVLSVIVNALLVGRVVKRLGERRALLFGLCCGVMGFLIYGAAYTGWLFLIGLPVSALWAIAAPASQALITREVGPQAQGRVQGALSSLTSLGGMIGPLLFAGSFSWLIAPSAPVYLPGVAFYLASALLAVGVVVAWRYARPSRDAGKMGPPPSPLPAQET